MDKTSARKRLFIILVATVIVLVLAAGMVFFLKSQIQNAIYQERRESLQQLLHTSIVSINDNVSTQWEVAHVYENDLIAHISDYDTVEEYLQYLSTQISVKGDKIFLVDSRGKYYCSDGISGKIITTEYYLSATADELEYLDTLPHLQEDQTYLILRSRLSQPITAASEKNGNVEIRYCCLLHNLTPLMEHVNNLFNGKNNAMIYDTQTGLMLYKHFGIRLLIDGYNVYEKYKKADLLYGADGLQTIEEVQNRQSSITLMNLKGEQYYLCSGPLDVSNWSLMLVVEGEYFNSASQNIFTRILFTVSGILGFAALLAVALFFYFNKLKTNRLILENERRANEALNEAYQMKSNFLSYMSHDIRTPINGMIGMSKIGLDNIDNTEKVQDCFRKIDLSSKHLLAIVNDVLDMSAIESGKIVISKEKMNLIGTLSGCLDIIRGTLNGRDLHIEEDYRGTDWNVLGDEFHLKQVVINILSNAVKFTNDGGTIKVSCEQLQEEAGVTRYKIAISDTGIGMTEEFKEHIFEAFRTATPDGKTRFKGSGLGMAISHEYVRLMNGTITVDSMVNVGSTFTLMLPYEKAETPAAGLDPKTLNVLLVDDNELNLEIALEMLKDEVKTVQMARNGKEALDAFLNSGVHAFDLILMDVMMPEMNGLESTKAIRASGREDSNIAILALTANTYKDDIDAIFACGMNGYLNKPFSVDQLLEKIRRGDLNS